MRLLIGGLAQGKLACAIALTGAKESDILHGDSCALSGDAAALVLDGADQLVRRCMEAGLDPMPVLDQLVERNPKLVITARELGCGIVPMERFERNWRELSGRVCCVLAARAKHVDRVICGLRTRIK